MTYLTQSTIADDGTTRSRVAQAAAQEGCATDGIDPDLWAMDWRRVWASSPGWDAAWESALANPDNPDNYDPAGDEAVITDGMILAEVQAMKPFVRLSNP